VEIGRRIYYDVTSGEVIANTGERSGDVVETTVEYDIKVYKSLSERNLESFDYIELEYEQNAKDFAACYGYRVNPDTKQLEFSYPDPNKPEPEKPTYRPPLSEEVERTKSRVADLELTIAEMMAQ
jgi:hypothetical protein